MDIQIIPIQLGFDTCYIIKSEGAIVIDGGAPKKFKNFEKALKKNAIKPEDISLIILTHGHFDHIASAKEIKEYTGAMIVMHQKEAEWLEKSMTPLPPGVTLWGKIFINILLKFMPYIKIPPAKVDIKLEDSPFDLHEYGIPGKIIHTPGHSKGSVSVLLDSGQVFVGDLAMNSLPLRFTPGLPIFAEDAEQVKISWQRLLDSGAKTVYPAHGKHFSAEIIRKNLHK